MTSDNSSDAAGRAVAREADRRRRLANALRENLKRRKQQARARACVNAPDDAEPGS